MNMTLDEYKARAKADLDNAFEKGKSQGGGDITQNPLYYMNIIDNQWRYAAFPEGFDFVLCLKTLPSNMNSLLMNTTGIKTATLSCDVSGVTNFSGLIRGSTVEMLDISNFKPIPNNINYFALSNTRIAQIKGELDLSSCTTANNSFNGTTALEEIRFKEGTISIALDFKSCTKLSAESYDSIMQGLSSTATGQTLTLTKYATVKATFDAKNGEGAWDILAASKTNWTIAYS